MKVLTPSRASATDVLAGDPPGIFFIPPSMPCTTSMSASPITRTLGII